MKKRADVFLSEEGYFSSREKAKHAITERRVLVNDLFVRPCDLVDDASKVEVLENDKYVSRGGLKLEYALRTFDISLEGKCVLDIGASTGGFTDCALQSGSKKVFAVENGVGQLDKKLLSDDRVVNLEKTDAKTISEEVFACCDFICMDVSFVSAVKILEPVSKKIKNGTTLVLLVKPQFEAGPVIMSKCKGVIKEYAVAEKVCIQTICDIEKLNFEMKNRVVSPIKGGDGNTEFLTHFIKR